MSAPNYWDWWLHKKIRVAGNSGPFKRCVKIDLFGPPSFVYGTVMLTFEDGTTANICPVGAFRPRKCDVEVEKFSEKGDK